MTQRPACLLAQHSRGCVWTRHTACMLVCLGSPRRARCTGAVSRMASQQIDIAAMCRKNLGYILSFSSCSLQPLQAFKMSYLKILRHNGQGITAVCPVMCQQSRNNATFPVKLVNTSRAMLYRHAVAVSSSSLTVMNKPIHLLFRAESPR